MSSIDASLAVAEFASATSRDDLADGVIVAAQRSLLDAVGVSLAASGLDDRAAEFARVVTDEGGRHDSTVLGFGVRVPAAAAAFANGALAHALDFEDSYDPAPVHPNAQVVPAVLALGERDDVSGSRLVTALAVGCDLTCRLASAVGSAMADRGWYPPPILGAIGATAAGANLLQLDTRTTLDALSLAISQATASGEVKHSPGSTIRGVRDSFASHAAVRSVELARRGTVGFDRPLDGSAGFFATYTGGDWEPAALLDDLGSRFAGPDVSFKPWPSCRGTHAFIGAALDLRTKVEHADVAAVELRGADFNRMLAEPHAAKATPTTAIDAKFSLPFTVASALVRGAVTLESFSAVGLRDPAVLDLAERVRYTVDPEVRGATEARVTVRLRDGTTVTERSERALGAPDAPLDDDALNAKFLDGASRAARPVVDAAALADRLLSIDIAPSWRSVATSLLA